MEGAAEDRDPRSYTPKHLADKILQSKSALEGERKQVTVLFADVKGSTGLAQGLDPEQWYGISDRFLQILADGIHRFEGTVNQFTGDGVMALFGAPIAHEDHAQRACYTALHLRDALKQYGDEVRRSHGITLAFRIGINSGEVVVGKIGDDLRMDYTAAGLTTNLADRVQKLADPGTVNVSEHTSRLVEGYFRLRDLGGFELPGASERVGIHELEGVGEVRTRLEGALRRGFSKFVGREDEMATLDAARRRALEVDGRVVGVVGEAGVGKSRLCREFIDTSRAKGLQVFETHCPAHGKTLPLFALLSLLRSLFGIADRDTDHDARRKITGELLLLDEVFQDALPLVFQFLGVPDPDRPAPEIGADASRLQLYEFVRRLVRSRAARDGLVLLVDDLHWVDAESDAFIAQIVEALRGTRALLLVNFRPEYEAPWTARPHYQQVPLSPLTSEATRDLLGDLLGKHPSTHDLRDQIHERTAGNPFFIEELVQSLAESGTLLGTRGRYQAVKPTGTLEIPVSVEAVLAARLDRLQEREKQVLQTAAVIGKRFSGPLLARVIELPQHELSAALDALRDAGFVHEETIYPETEYAFKHPLTHDVALDSQLGERRQRCHAAVARALEQVRAAKLDEQAAELAYHWREAGRSLDAARWYGRAADWTERTHKANAFEYWCLVRGLLPIEGSAGELAELSLRARERILNLGLYAGLGRDETERIYVEGRELVSHVRDPTLESRLLTSYLVMKPLVALPDLEDAGRAYEALRLVEPLDRDAYGSAAAGVYQVLLFLGRVGEAQTVLEDAIERGSELPILHGCLVTTLQQQGRLSQARRENARQAELLQRQGGMEPSHRLQAGQIEGFAGDYEKLITLERRAVEEAERLEQRFFSAFTHRYLGLGYLGLERYEEAIAALESSIRISEEIDQYFFNEPIARAWLAEARLRVGDAGEALTMVESLLERELSRWVRLKILVPCARVLRQTGGQRVVPRVEALLDEATQHIEETGFRLHAPSVIGERAEVARVRGNLEARLQHLREAHRLYTEMGATRHAERVARELDELVE